MELPRDGDYRHTLHFVEGKSLLKAFVIRRFQRDDDSEGPRSGARYDLEGSFATKAEAYPAGILLVRKIVSGEAHPTTESITESVGQYRVMASAAFRVDRLLWEPTLTLKSKRPENKGALQEFNSSQSALLLNLFPEANSAAKFALEYARRLITRQITGLKI